MICRKTTGFTLVELLVSISISVTIISGMAFVFQSLTDNFTEIRYINKTYNALDNFTDDYDTLRNDFPKLLMSTGGIFTGSPYGFQTIAFTNTGLTEGFLLMAIDITTNKIITGSGLNYTHTVPATAKLTNAQISSIQSNFPAFLSGANTIPSTIYTSLPIIKLNFFPLNNTDIGKLDLTTTPAYYDIFKSQTIHSVLENPLFEFYSFSHIR